MTPNRPLIDFSNSLDGNIRKKEVGHFTQIVRDVSISVGCSISQYVKNDLYNIYYVCDYAVANNFDHQIYDEGPTASKCETGTNPKYPALCSEKEKYDDLNIPLIKY